eukprot:421330_1
MRLLLAIYFITAIYGDSSRLLLQNCGNCGINPCYGCGANGQCDYTKYISGCCFSNNDCEANQICNGRRCQDAQPAQSVGSPCQKSFCACPMNYDPVYCIDSRKTYSNECSAVCNCEQNCVKI